MMESSNYTSAKIMKELFSLMRIILKRFSVIMECLAGNQI